MVTERESERLRDFAEVSEVELEAELVLDEMSRVSLRVSDLVADATTEIDLLGVWVCVGVATTVAVRDGMVVFVGRTVDVGRSFAVVVSSKVKEGTVFETEGIDVWLEDSE